MALRLVFISALHGRSTLEFCHDRSAMGIWEILGNRVDWQGFIGSRAHVLRHGLMGHQAFVHA